MEKLKQFFQKTMDKLKSIYTGEHNILAAAITITGITALSVIGIIIIKVTTSDTDATASTTPAVIKESSTTEEMTTVIETTTAETTTQEVTTEAETTTEEPTTEAPTQPPVKETVPETIPIEEISTVAQKEAEKFDAQEEARRQMAAEEPTEAPTTAPNNNASQTNTQKPVEKPTEPPKVSENAKLVTGIDISHWQTDRGKIDWNKVKNDNIDYVIIKAAGRSIGSSGSLYEDTAFRENIEGALSAGIPVGVYFFSQAVNEQEAREEASLILALIKDYKITYPVVFDWETSNGYRTYSAGLSKEKMNSIASTFCDMVKAAGYTPMVYGNGWDLVNRYNFDELGAKYKIWLARYPACYGGTVRYKVGDALPSGKNIPSTYQMWQYCSDGIVDGITGNVDVNVSFFSYSGTEVPTTAIRLDIANSSLTTNLGTAIDLMDGVTGYNTAGLENKDAISVTVTNSAGETVSQEAAFGTAGTYTVTYRLRDFTGASKSAAASLIVRGTPTLTLTTDTIKIKYNDTINFVSSFKNGGYKNYILSAQDFEGNDISQNVSVALDNGLEQILSSGNVISGSYAATFNADDEKGMKHSVSLKIIIEEQETTTPAETSATEAADKNETTATPETSYMNETTDTTETSYINETTAMSETSYINETATETSAYMSETTAMSEISYMNGIADIQLYIMN